MISKKVEANVLFIGRSGVGKSSLLNYMFNRELEKTGVGKPCTGMGVFPHSYKMKENFILHIYDSWGLEPDKAEKWRDLILNEIRKHDKQKMSEWFNTIFYLLNGNSSRVEDFEIETLNSLTEQGNEIIVVFTHCKEGAMEKCNGMKNRILQKTKIRPEQIVYVNSVENKPLGQQNVEKSFGKEKLFSAIEDNLWRSLWKKVPYLLKQDGTELLEKWADNEFQKIEAEVGWFTKIDKKAKEVYCDYQGVIVEITNKLNERIEDTNDYYNTVKTYLGREMGIELVAPDKVRWKRELQTDEYFKKEIGQILQRFNLVKERKGVWECDVPEIFTKLAAFVASAKDRKRCLQESLTQFAKNANCKLEEEIDRITQDFEVEMQREEQKRNKILI